MRKMKETFKKNCIIISAICVINLIATIIFIIRLPDTVPTHFDFNMVCDGIGSRWSGIIASAILCITVPLLIIGEGHGKNASVNSKPMLIVLYFTTFLIVTVNWLVLMMMESGVGIGEKINMEFGWIVLFLLGFMLLIIGNYMPTVRHNYTLGIRLPWTLKNEKCWNLTHRLAGKLHVLGGILTLATAMAVKILDINYSIAFIVYLVLIIPVTILIPTVYAYQHRND